MLHAIVFVIVAIVMFLALYLVIHRYFPSWGTVISNSITGLAVAFQLQTLAYLMFAARPLPQ